MYSRKNTLPLTAIAIVACGLLIGCSELARNSRGGNGGSGRENLAITAVLSRTSVATGGTATLTVTVTNNGAAATSATMATLYRSTDTRITTADTVVGTAQPISRIAAKETTTARLTIPASETGTVGMRNYGVCIPRSGAAICSSALTLAVTASPAPDLNVQGATPTLSQTSYMTGASATIRIVVTNSGSTNSTDGTVTFYRQAGGAPDTSADTSVGTYTLSAISSESGSNTATAMATFNVGAVGMALYYAVVTGATGDANEANNTSAPTAPIAITVPAPDLVITTLASTKIILSAGDTFTAAVVVQNAGSVEAAATDVSFALVNDEGSVVMELTGTIDDVPALDAGASTSVTDPLRNTITVPADTAVGTYRLRATVGTVENETNTANNTFLLGGEDPINITISADQAADLDLSGMMPTLTPDIARYAMGDEVTISVNVFNRGNADSGDSTVSFYRQTGESPDTSADTAVGTPHALSAIAAGGNETATSTITVGDVGAGVVYYAVVSATGDDNATNNTSASTAPVTITVAPAPDLDVSGVPVALNAESYTEGDEATIRVAVSNTGDADSTVGATVSFYRQRGESPAPATDTEIATIPVPVIEVGTSEPVSTTFDIGSAGTDVLYYAVISQVAGERDRDDNRSMASSAVTINAPPDLRITTFGTSSTVTAGDVITATLTIRNDGNIASAATTVLVELLDSRSMPLSTGGLTGSAIDVSTIDGGEDVVVSGDFTVSTDTPAGDMYRLRATVATVADETATDNNALLFGGTPPTDFVVSAIPVPDLDVGSVQTTVSDAAEYDAGDMVTLSVVVTNGGTQASSNGTVTFYRQAGGSPAPETDAEVGATHTLGTIAEDDTETATSGTFALGTAGTGVQYYAVVSGVTDENNDSNNTSMPSDGITIIELGPDLVVSDVQTTVSAAGSYIAGNTVTLSVVVTNGGNEASSEGTVSFYRAAGTEIDRTADGAAVATAILAAVAAAGSSGNTATATADITLGAAATGVRYYAVVSGVAGETDDSNNTSLLSDAITVVARTIDLTAAKPTVSVAESYTEEDTVTLSVVITNNGNVRSTDGMVNFYRQARGGAGIFVGTADTLPAIAAGGSATATLDFALNGAGTNVQYSVFIAGVTGETDTSNNGSVTSDGIDIIELGPDLRITAFTVAPNPVVRGEDVTVDVTVENIGNATSAMTAVRLELHTFGGTILTTPNITDTVDVAPINAGMNSGMISETITIPANIPHATWGLRAVVNNVRDETDTGNNAFSLAGGFTINDRTIDLTAAKPTVSAAESYTEGDTVTLSVVVTNNGTLASAGGTVTFYRQASGSPTPVTDDKVGAEHTLRAIAADGNETATTRITLSRAGTNVRYYAVVSGVRGETDTDNNISTPSDAITITVRIN